MPEQVLELADIQALILSSHRHLLSSSYLLLRVGNAQKAKAWLTKLIPQISTAKRRDKSEAKPKTAVHVAFTYPGLRQLGIHGNDLKKFPTEFQEGMVPDYRSRILGDTEDSTPDKWEWGGRGNSPEVHILLLVYGDNRALVDGICGSLQETLAADGLGLVAREDSEDRPDGSEPFGFHDGIAQPIIEGGHYKPTSGEPLVRAGEFMLGYLNEYNKLPDSPIIKGSAGGTLDLGKNGSYVVFRKLRQDVDGFWKFVGQKSQDLIAPAGTAKNEWLAAKMVGRWKSGAPLVLAPEKDDPALGRDKTRNDKFLYIGPDANRKIDAHGLACPRGAHIRRCNPRDSLFPGPEESLTMVNRHRIIRRGRPYEHKATDGGTEQGLYFIAINANIQRQFEFIQQTWINNPKFDGLYDNKDPLLGDNKPPPPGNPYDNCTMNIPDTPVRQRVHGLPRFVQVRAGAYFFLPGIRALKFLAG